MRCSTDKDIQKGIHDGVFKHKNITSPNLVGTQNVDDPPLYGTTFALNGSSLYFNVTINIDNLKIVSNATIRRSTAVHELGHGLGLSHEKPPVNAVMNSSRDRTITYILQTDDIKGINTKYPF
ncbi:matrixin family metalloprotease [Lysinibacillus sp. NPDC059133]|uniref:matrixin family metalloprotease n=1 Tax=Lysinibacillus sp. NPDC059133 TaxID=3346737 RepID=UPI0036A8B24A